MEKMTTEEMFVAVVSRINRLLILLGIFFFIYFLFNTKLNVYLFLLALLNTAFSLLSYKHLTITNRLAVELRRARTVLDDVTRETRQMHDA